MQIVGISATQSAFDAIAQRSNRESVSRWIKRTLTRQIRRDPTLLTRVVGRNMEKALSAAMKADKIPVSVCDRILNEWSAGADVFIPSKTAIARLLERARDTVDWLESLGDDDRRIKRIDKMSWEEAETQSRAWHKALAKDRKIKNLHEGVIKVMDMPGGAFMAELTSKNALKNEGQFMGHCVGGYWDRVQKGGVRIFSLRDAEGKPHVTIELNKARAIADNDGRIVYTNDHILNGVNNVRLTKNPWYAVQVRGKQNQLPVEKYQKLVEQWMVKECIPWKEFGSNFYEPDGLETIKVFAAYGKPFSTADACSQYGEAKVEEHIEKNPDEYFGRLYNQSGLRSVHAEIDKGKVSDFFARNRNAIMSSIARCNSKSITSMMQMSGLAFAPASTLTTEFYDKVFEPLLKEEPEYDMKVSALCRVNPKTELKMVVHTVPLMPVFLLSGGFMPEKAGEFIEATRDRLLNVLSNIKLNTSAVHVINSHSGAVQGDDIRKAFLIAGLGSEYSQAVEQIHNAVVICVKDINRAAKEARTKPGADLGSINVAANFAAEGWEKRIENRVKSKLHGSYLLLSPAPKKEFVVRPWMVEDKDPFSRRVVSLGL